MKVLAGWRRIPSFVLRHKESHHERSHPVVSSRKAESGSGDPVSRFIPAFAKTTVATGTVTRIELVPARRSITIRDLLTHTAGISYGAQTVAALYAEKGFGPAAGFGWYTADKDEPICATMERLGSLPFVAQPGEAYVYGYNTDILGCVVERLPECRSMSSSVRASRRRSA